MNPILFLLYIFTPASLSLICMATFYSVCDASQISMFSSSTPDNFESVRGTLGLLVILAMYFIGQSYRGYKDLKEEN